MRDPVFENGAVVAAVLVLNQNECHLSFLVVGAFFGGCCCREKKEKEEGERFFHGESPERVGKFQKKMLRSMRNFVL